MLSRLVNFSVGNNTQKLLLPFINHHNKIQHVTLNRNTHILLCNINQYQNLCNYSSNSSYQLNEKHNENNIGGNSIANEGIIDAPKKKRTRRSKKSLDTTSTIDTPDGLPLEETATAIATGATTKKRIRKTKTTTTTTNIETPSPPINTTTTTKTNVQLPPGIPLKIKIVDNDAKNDISYIGIDEAGKGAVLGPLVIAAVSLDAATERYLKSAGVKDSKKLTPQRREELYDIIKERALYTTIYILEARDIDLRRQTQTLNKIESDIFIELIQRSVNSIKIIDQEEAEELLSQQQDSSDNSNKQKMRKFKIQLDSLESNTGKFSLPFKDAFPSPEHTVICENQADSKYVSTGAASIIAKVERDRAIAALEKSVNQPVGCGYPSDSVTLSFIESFYQKNGYDHQDVRLTWKTLTNKRGTTMHVVGESKSTANATAVTKPIGDTASTISSSISTTADTLNNTIKTQLQNNTINVNNHEQISILQKIQQDLSALSQSVQSLINSIQSNNNNSDDKNKK